MQQPAGLGGAHQGQARDGGGQHAGLARMGIGIAAHGLEEQR